MDEGLSGWNWKTCQFIQSEVNFSVSSRLNFLSCIKLLIDYEFWKTYNLSLFAWFPLCKNTIGKLLPCTWSVKTQNTTVCKYFFVERCIFKKTILSLKCDMDFIKMSIIKFRTVQLQTWENNNTNRNVKIRVALYLW